MSREPFLINPSARRRAKKGVRRRAKAMRNVWSERTATKTIKFSPLHSRAAKKGWTRKRSGKVTSRRVVKRKKNPFGEEVILVGNPIKRRRKRSRRKSSTLYVGKRHRANPKRHSKRRRTYRRYAANPVRHHAKRRRSRRHHRNPMGNMLKNPMSMLVPIASGIAAKVAVEKVPAMLGMTSPTSILGTQIAIAVGGTMLMKKMGGAKMADAAHAFGIVAGTLVAVSIINQYILPTLGMTTLLGLGEFAPNPSVAYTPPTMLPGQSTRVAMSGLEDDPMGNMYQY